MIITYSVYFKSDYKQIQKIVSTDKDLCCYRKKYLPVKDGLLEEAGDGFWVWHSVDLFENVMSIFRLVKSLKSEQIVIGKDYDDEVFTEGTLWEIPVVM